MTSIGFAQVDITCAPGTPLGGNARADKAARGTHDALHATVAVIASGDDVYALIGLDLVSAPLLFATMIAKEVEECANIPARCVVVSATHTHSGPDVDRGHGMDDLDYSSLTTWETESVPAIGDAAFRARQSAVPASASLASTRIDGLSFNRRLAMRDGSTHMNWEDLDTADVRGPLGPIDPELNVLVFSAADGSVLGTLVHFTLHPAILVGHDWLVSADYVAELSTAVSNAVDGAPVLFVNGALGNINHLDYRNQGRAIGFSESARIGNALGSAAVKALSGARAEMDLANTGFTTFTVTLEQRTVDRGQLTRANALLEANAGQPVDALDGIPAEAYAKWSISRGRELTPLVDVDVTVVRLGSLVLVYVPFEVFVEFGLALRAAFPDFTVRVVSLAGGSHGYLPTATAFAEGGYEPTFGTSTIKSGQGEYLFSRVTRELHAQLEGNND